MVGCGDAAWVPWGGVMGAWMASRTPGACSSSVLRKCERVIRFPSCHTSTSFFGGNAPQTDT